MKNIYSIEQFKKVYEADKFSNDTTFSDSLVGRAFNSIFKMFRKQVNKARLVFFKRKLEDEYLKGVLSSLKEDDISKFVKEKEDLKNELEEAKAKASKGEDLEDTDDEALDKLSEVQGYEAEEDEDMSRYEEEEEDEEEVEEKEPEKEVKKIRIFSKYDEYKKTIDGLSQGATEDDVKIIKKIHKELTEIKNDLTPTVQWYEANPNRKNKKEIEEKYEVLKKESNYVSKLIADCDNIIKKYPNVKDEMSDQDYEKIIQTDQKALTAGKETALATTNTKVDKAYTSLTNTLKDIETNDVTVEVNNQDDIMKQLNVIHDKLKASFKNSPEKIKKLDQIWKKHSMMTHQNRGKEVDKSILKNFYNSVKTLEKLIVDMSENSNYRNFIIDKYLNEAYLILEQDEPTTQTTTETNPVENAPVENAPAETKPKKEKTKKDTTKLGRKLSKLVNKPGYEQYTDLDLDSNKLAEYFKQNPDLKIKATESVNKERIKEIEYSSELLWSEEFTPAANALFKNFHRDAREAKLLEMYWKKLVAGVKKGFVLFLDVDALDPIKLALDDKRLRDETLSNKGVNLDPAKDANKTWSAAIQEGKNSTIGLGKKPPWDFINDGDELGDDTTTIKTAYGSIFSRISNKDVMIFAHFFRKRVISSTGTEKYPLTWRIVNLYDMSKIYKKSDAELKNEKDYNEFILNPKTDSAVYKYLKFAPEKRIYCQLPSVADDTKCDQIDVDKLPKGTRHIKIYEWTGSDLKNLYPTIKNCKELPGLNTNSVVSIKVDSNDKTILPKYGITNEVFTKDQKEINMLFNPSNGKYADK